jgi:hypothetical protein
VSAYDVQAEALFPGWLSKLLTTPIHGLERYDDMVRRRTRTATRSRCT